MNDEPQIARSPLFGPQPQQQTRWRGWLATGWPYVGPLVLLLLLVLLALVVAYARRPMLAVDVGDYYDRAYLRDFHAREVDTVGAGAAWQWPAESRAITLPGGLAGDWLATVQAPPDLPGRPMSMVALAVNGQPVRIPRDSSHTFTAFIPAELAAAERLTLRLRPALSGGRQPDPGIAARVVLQPARTYRWTQGTSTIALPGLGRGAWIVALDLVTAHPDGHALDAHVLANGALLATLPDSPTLRRVRLLVPGALLDQGGGSLDLTLQAQTFADPRPLGMLVSALAVAPASPTTASGQQATWPPWGVLLASLVIVAGAYSGLALLLGTIFPTRPSQPGEPAAAPWLAGAGALALLLLGLWALTAHRFSASQMLPGLAGLTLWSLVLLVLLRPLMRRVFAQPDEPGSTATVERLIAGLLLIFFAGYWLKAGGMLYPYFVGIDVSWHMDRVRWILSGQLPLLYGVESPLNESTMPLAEWGPERPVIPYSPYFHIFATSFGLLPWPLEFSANMFSALVDCSRVLLVGLVAWRVGLGARAALLAAGLLALLPVNFLLHSWGNIPTTFGLWWAFAATVGIILAWPLLVSAAHRRRRLVLAGLVLLLLGALLIYTVAGVFVGLFLICFTLALWGAAWRSGNGRWLLAGLRPLWLAVGVALGLALLLYYGQYVLPIIERTLPYFVAALSQSREATGRVGDTWGAYLLRHGRLADYGLVIPLLLTSVYLVWEWLRRFGVPDQPAQAGPDAQPDQTDQANHAGAMVLWAAVAGWLAVLILFVPAGYKISLVDKHFFVAIPLLVLASAVVLDRLWAWGGLRFAVLLLYFAQGAAAVALWLARIVGVQQG